MDCKTRETGIFILSTTIQEFFVYLDEKAHNLYTETLVLKERLILKLMF